MTAGSASAPRPCLLLLGHGNPSGAIAVFRLDGASGALAPAATLHSGSSSSFLALDPTQRFLYATQNRGDEVSAFAFDPATGEASPLGRVPVPPGPGAAESGPSYLRVDAGGRFLFCANYRGHTVAVWPRASDGTLGPLLQNLSAGRHAHAVVCSPDQRFLFVPFLGSDLVAQYRIDPDGGPLRPNQPPAVATAPGAGPRHLTFHPDGTHAYLVNELDGTVVAFAYDAGGGTLLPRQCLDSLPAGYQGRRWAADIHVHPSGAFLYASNRAADSLTVFAIDPGTHLLTLLGHHPSQGRTPRSFCLDPAGRFLFVANQDSSNLVTFAIHPETGRLDPVADRPVAPSPTFVGTLAG